MLSKGLKCKTINGEKIVCDNFLELSRYCSLDDVDTNGIKYETALKDKNGKSGYIGDYWMNDAGSKYKLIWNEATSSLKLYDEYFHCITVSAIPKFIIAGTFVEGD